jgi:murein DD-endopeptidase MepM/ murein hydrolase activator NlpD
VRHLKKGLFLCFCIAFLGSLFYQHAQWQVPANIINSPYAADLEKSQWTNIPRMAEQAAMNMEPKTSKPAAAAQETLPPEVTSDETVTTQETPLPEATGNEATAGEAAETEPAAQQEITAAWAEDTDIQRSRDESDEERPWIPGHFIWPIEGALITAYGFEYAPTFADYRFHSGIDIAAVPGALAAAAAPGKVVKAEKSLWLGYEITVDHGHGWMSRYYHLESITVRPDEIVQAGQALGAIGQPGLYEEKEGPHVHFEILYEGVHIDPLLVVTER